MNRKRNKFGKIKAYNLDKFTLYSFVSRIRNAHERTRCRERSSFRPGRWLPSTVAPFVENSDTFDSGRSHLVNQRRKISIHREMVARYLDTSRDFAKRKKDHTETFVRNVRVIAWFTFNRFSRVINSISISMSSSPRSLILERLVTPFPRILNNLYSLSNLHPFLFSLTLSSSVK